MGDVDDSVKSRYYPPWLNGEPQPTEAERRLATLTRGAPDRATADRWLDQHAATAEA